MNQNRNENPNLSILNSGELFRPLATVIMSGLALATILTLVVVPTIYYKINGKKLLSDRV